MIGEPNFLDHLVRGETTNHRLKNSYEMPIINNEVRKFFPPAPRQFHTMQFIDTFHQPLGTESLVALAYDQLAL